MNRRDALKAMLFIPFCNEDNGKEKEERKWRIRENSVPLEDMFMAWGDVESDDKPCIDMFWSAEEECPLPKSLQKVRDHIVDEWRDPRVVRTIVLTFSKKEEKLAHKTFDELVKERT